MTVEQLIVYLQKFPQNLHVAYKLYSEQCLLDPEDIRLCEECEPRIDGWIENRRPDKPKQIYVMFPGN